MNIITSISSIIEFMVGFKRRVPCKTLYKPYVSILIPAFNEEAVIHDTLMSIQKQTYPNIREIIVIDDCSTDTTGEIARKFGAVVIRTPVNTGSKSKAQNCAIPLVKSPIFVTIDADTTLESHAIEKLVIHLSDGKTLSVCGFVIPQVINTLWERSRTIEYLYGLGLFKSAQEHLSIPIVSSGCFSAFNTKLVREVGMFPEWCIAEDMALTWLAHLRGYKIKYISDAISYPKEPSNWKQYKGQILRWYRGFAQCVAKYNISLFRKPLLGAFIVFYIIQGVLTPVWLAFVIWVLVDAVLHGSTSISTLIFTIFIIEVVIGYGTVLIKGYQTNNLKTAATCYPLLWFISPINGVVFVYSLVQEWILKKKLTTWDKGH